jgi:hypothetical protein
VEQFILGHTYDAYLVLLAKSDMTSRGRVRSQSLQGVFRGQLTAPYSPPHNGVLKWRNHMVMGATHSMFKAKEVPGMFYGEAVMTAAYILNRSMPMGAGGRILYELWMRSTASVQHLRTFQCVAHVKDARPHLQELEDSSP